MTPAGVRWNPSQRPKKAQFLGSSSRAMDLLVFAGNLGGRHNSWTTFRMLRILSLMAYQRAKRRSVGPSQWDCHFYPAHSSVVEAHLRNSKACTKRSFIHLCSLGWFFVAGRPPNGTYEFIPAWMNYEKWLGWWEKELFWLFLLPSTLCGVLSLDLCKYFSLPSCLSSTWGNHFPPSRFNSSVSSKKPSFTLMRHTLLCVPWGLVPILAYIFLVLYYNHVLSLRRRRISRGAELNCWFFSVSQVHIVQWLTWRKLIMNISLLMKE